eukprot:525789-Prorocentrum_minimum.AAC.3
MADTMFSHMASPLALFTRTNKSPAFDRDASWLMNSLPSTPLGWDNEKDDHLMFVRNPLQDTPVLGRLENSIFSANTPRKTPIKFPMLTSRTELAYGIKMWWLFASLGTRDAFR